MRTETGLVQERCGEVVPSLERATVDTGDLVVGQLVVLVLALESLHAEEVQVPLVSVLLQLAELQTGS
jgi:hypothetical protein